MELDVIENDVNKMNTDEQFVHDLLYELVHGDSISEDSNSAESHVRHRVDEIDENESIIGSILKEYPAKIKSSLIKRDIFYEAVYFCDRAYQFKSSPVFSESPYKEYLEEILNLGDSIFYCFTDEGLLLSKERLIFFACELGKICLKKPGLISTVLGVDSFMVSKKIYIELVNPEFAWVDGASTKLPLIESDISSLLIELDGHEISKSQLYKVIILILTEMAFCFLGGKFESINGVSLSYLAIALNHFIENILVDYNDISQTLLKLTNTICECISTKFFEMPDDV